MLRARQERPGRGDGNLCGISGRVSIDPGAYARERDRRNAVLGREGQRVSVARLELRGLTARTSTPDGPDRVDDVRCRKPVSPRYPRLAGRAPAQLPAFGKQLRSRRAGIPTWAVSGAFMNPDDMYAHGLNERVPIETFYEALDHWSIILRELASD